MPAQRQSEPVSRAAPAAPDAPPATTGWARAFRLWPRSAAIAAVRLYQRAVSPWLPAVFGAGCGCRFHPTCSQYAIDALRQHGFFAGVYLAARRLLRCQPLHPGGEDPVPETFRWIPSRSRGSVPFSQAHLRRVTPHHG